MESATCILLTWTLRRQTRKIHPVLERVKTLGGELYRGPLKVVETQRIIMQIKDPFGNIIGFEAPLTE